MCSQICLDVSFSRDKNDASRTSQSLCDSICTFKFASLESAISKSVSADRYFDCTSNISDLDLLRAASLEDRFLARSLFRNSRSLTLRSNRATSSLKFALSCVIFSKDFPSEPEIDAENGAEVPEL